MNDALSIQNFRLNEGNARYFPILAAAEQDFGIPAAILASIITAEAVMRPVGGDIAWDDRSYNSSGEAAGLAQFTASSWQVHAARSGTVVNAAAIERGLVGANGDILDRGGLLDLRFDAVLSVSLTAETAARNYEVLKGQGIPMDELGTGAIAKILYLAHHEGILGAFDYLTGNRRPVTREHYEANVPPKRWKASLTSEEIANEYYAWLENYIDRMIDVRRYLHDSSSVAVPRLASLAFSRPRPSLPRRAVRKLRRLMAASK